MKTHNYKKKPIVTPTDVAENILVISAFSSVTGHNSNLEIRIRYNIMFSENFIYVKIYMN